MGFCNPCAYPMAVQQGRAAPSDGFLSSEEYSLWASTVKLEEHEAHPTLKQSRFVSLPGDPAPQVSLVLLSHASLCLCCKSCLNFYTLPLKYTTYLMSPRSKDEYMSHLFENLNNLFSVIVLVFRFHPLKLHIMTASFQIKIKKDSVTHNRKLL